MFEQIFARQSIIGRHRQGPLAEERRRYLSFKAEVGQLMETRGNTCCDCGIAMAGLGV
jgi:hypothetical protein